MGSEAERATEDYAQWYVENLDGLTRLLVYQAVLAAIKWERKRATFERSIERLERINESHGK